MNQPAKPRARRLPGHRIFNSYYCRKNPGRNYWEVIPEYWCLFWAWANSKHMTWGTNSINQHNVVAINTPLDHIHLTPQFQEGDHRAGPLHHSGQTLLDEKPSGHWPIIQLWMASSATFLLITVTLLIMKLFNLCVRQAIRNPLGPFDFPWRLMHENRGVHHPWLAALPV